MSDEHAPIETVRNAREHRRVGNLRRRLTRTVVATVGIPLAVLTVLVAGFGLLFANANSGAGLELGGTFLDPEARARQAAFEADERVSDLCLMSEIQCPVDGGPALRRWSAGQGNADFSLEAFCESDGTICEPAIIARGVPNGPDPALDGTALKTGASVIAEVQERWLIVGLAALAGLLVIAFVAATAWVTVDRTLRPISSMIGDVETIDAADLDHRLEVPANNAELAALSSTLNSMLSRISDGVRRQQQFVADASHELRTPITTIGTRLEGAISRPDSADWEGAAADSLAEQRRLKLLVEDLLALARVDSQTHREFAEVAVDELVLAEASRPWPKHVSVSRVSSGRTIGDIRDLTRVVDNLLVNAVRHAETQVDVSLVEDDSLVRLTVEDDGPGIPPADRQLVFERFRRRDDARDRDSGGAGLGLALVEQIVDAHRGTVYVDESPLGGARFVVTLPQP